MTSTFGKPGVSWSHDEWCSWWHQLLGKPEVSWSHDEWCRWWHQLLGKPGESWSHNEWCSWWRSYLQMVPLLLHSGIPKVKFHICYSVSRTKPMHSLKVHPHWCAIDEHRRECWTQQGCRKKRKGPTCSTWEVWAAQWEVSSSCWVFCTSSRVLCRLSMRLFKQNNNQLQLLHAKCQEHTQNIPWKLSYASCIAVNKTGHVQCPACL